MSCDSSVSIVSTYGLDDRDSIPGRGKNSLRHHVQTFLGSNHLLSGEYLGGSSTGTKWLKRSLFTSIY
jgi:hypothetical protein